MVAVMLVVAPPPKTPLHRSRWLWGSLAGASISAILIGTLAGLLAPPPAHVTIARP